MKEPNVYGQTDLTYNSYLRVPELLALQHPESNPPHHDELLFIIIHQAYELWFKLILHEVDQAMAEMRRGEALQAHHFMKRVGEIFRVLVQQIHILETMRPADFLEFRDRLNPASGFQSLQFRELEFVAGLKEPRYLQFFKNRPEMLTVLERRLKEPDLRTVFHGMLGKLGFAVSESSSDEDVIAAMLPVYQKPADHLPLYLLAESLVDLDQYLGLWRTHHVRVVERIIGFKRGTGGSSGVEYLQSTVSKKCFPALWDVRTHLKKE